MSKEKQLTADEIKKLKAEKDIIVKGGKIIKK